MGCVLAFRSSTSAPVARASRMLRGPQVVVFVGETCQACGCHRDAHRDTHGRWVGCNLARILKDAGLRVRKPLRCAGVSAFAIDAPL